MNIEIKKSIKPVKYNQAIKFLEARLADIYSNQAKDLIWILEHEEIYTAGTNYKKSEILNKSINLVETNRGGKITYHGPGQIICYFVIDLKKRKKDIRKFITLIEKTIIETLLEFDINIIDNSLSHKGHNNFDGNGETHIIVELNKNSLSKVNRLEIHRNINFLLKKEFEIGLHSLQIKIT